MTTKKRSKPRVVWVVLGGNNCFIHTFLKRQSAESLVDIYKRHHVYLGPFEIVKYTREVKRRKGR